jgi:hypothetical protein
MHGCGLHFAVGQSRVLLNALALSIFVHVHAQLSKRACLNMCVALAQYVCILCVCWCSFCPGPEQGSAERACFEYLCTRARTIIQTRMFD